MGAGGYREDTDRMGVKIKAIIEFNVSDTALEDALAAANAVGATVIAAAGNDGSDNDVWPTYPASYDLPNILAVAATDDEDDLASGSGWS